ncbi:MAG: Glu/Leu/Phe/Val dehydrogenase dimerization domain-containing protein [Promethearchaeota archaeon]
MIPKKLEEFLQNHISETVLKNRLKKDHGMCFLEFSHTDELLLSSLGITRDKFGPELVVCIWDESSDLEIGGYLIVDNLSMGKPSMGGIRMLPDITPSDIYNLARGMTLKNAAADLPYGGGKAGIVADRNITQEQHKKVIQGFARLIFHYKEKYVPGPDVGTNDADMKIIAIENGLDSAVSKPADMGGNRIDELGGAAGGIITALLTLVKIMPRLRVLNQFINLEIPKLEDLRVLIQGFGAVGAHTARILNEKHPEAKIIGLSDIEGYIFNNEGLPIKDLFEIWKKEGIVTKSFFKKEIISKGPEYPIKYSTNPNNLLLENAFCLIPAAPIFNYLGVYHAEKPSMLVNRMHPMQWSLIVEGANTYSPDPNRKAARTRMEQIVYREKGVMIARDYLVNSGGVIFAAQEHIIKTPDHLQIPEKLLGNEEEVNKWLKKHESEFVKLSMKRLEAGGEYRKKVIRRNMVELVDLLAGNPDILPSMAAEQISVQRLLAKERQKTAKDIMVPIPSIEMKSTVQEAAQLMIKENSDIIAVISENRLKGVVTDWNITKAASEGNINDLLNKIMTRDVIKASPNFTILDIIRELEQYKISAMLVVDNNGEVLGKISSDLIAQHYLMNLLQSH